MAIASKTIYCFAKEDLNISESDYPGRLVKIYDLIPELKESYQESSVFDKFPDEIKKVIMFYEILACVSDEYEYCYVFSDYDSKKLFFAAMKYSFDKICICKYKKNLIELRAIHEVVENFNEVIDFNNGAYFSFREFTTSLNQKVNSTSIIQAFKEIDDFMNIRKDDIKQMIGGHFFLDKNGL